MKVYFDPILNKLRRDDVKEALSGGSGLNTRITNLENNVYKITYYQIVSGTSGSLTIPANATINANEFGLSGNAILSKINGSNKPTYESPQTIGGSIVTASLNTSTGAWVASDIYTDTNVALIYSISISALYYSNLDSNRIIETVDLASNGGGTVSGGIPHGTASGTDTYTVTIVGATTYADGDAYLIKFPNGNTTGATININGLGAVSLYRNNDGPLIGGDIIDGAEMLCVYNATNNNFQCIGTSPNTLLSYVTNVDSVTITKGQPVYAFGGTGDRMTVKLAYNTSDATSAQTVGLVLSTSIAAGQKGIIIMQGLLDGLSTLPTSTFGDGNAIYLGPTAGSITNVKPHAPNHLVYLGVVTTASPGASGRMYVRVQNGYELDELHNVQAQNPSLKDTLYYDNTVTPAQWKTASISSILGYTPANNSNVVHLDGTEIITGLKTFTNLVNIGNAVPTNQRQVRIGQDTAIVDIGSFVGNTAQGAIYLSKATPSSTNHSFRADSSNTFINTNNGFIYFSDNNVTRFYISSTGAGTNFIGDSGNAKTSWLIDMPFHTTQTASTNIPNFKVTGNNKQWNAGAITDQYWNYFTANTASFATTASTITNSYGLFVEAAIAGTNASITNNFGIGTNGNILSTSSYLYLGTSSPSLSNFSLRSTSSGLEVNSQSQAAPIYFRLGTSNRFIVHKNGTVGAENSFTFLPNNNTNQDASTEISAYLGQNFSRQWIGGNITTQREIYFKAATYNFTTNSTITNSYGAYFEAAIAGTNATIINNYALGINGNFGIIDGSNIILGTTTGTKIGTSTTQKLGFYNAAPIVQPGAVTTTQGIATALSNLGLLATSTIAQLNLNDLSDVVVSNPIVDQQLTWNGIKWTNANSATVNAGPGVTYFLTNNSAGFGTYEFMSKTPDTNPEDDETVTVNNNTVLLHEYISDVAFNKTIIDAGIWEFNYFTYVNTLSASFVTDVYKRTSGGTETLLFSVETSLISNTTVDLINTTTVQPQFTCNATDKLVIKISGKTIQTSNVILHLVHSGTEHYSHFHTPLVIVHNDIAGLQGGTSDQYYHLTQSEYTGTGTGNFVRANTPTLVNPVVGTQTQGDNSTKAASTEYVDTAVATVSTNYGLIYAVSTGNLFM
jgi:hypothetical protein